MELACKLCLILYSNLHKFRRESHVGVIVCISNVCIISAQAIAVTCHSNMSHISYSEYSLHLFRPTAQLSLQKWHGIQNQRKRWDFQELKGLPKPNQDGTPESIVQHMDHLFKQLWVSVCLCVRVYVTLFIAKIVAFRGSWLRSKASCAKHSLGREAP